MSGFDPIAAAANGNVTAFGVTFANYVYYDLQVILADGSPLPGVTVTIGATVLTTGADGRIAQQQLAAGAYQVKLEKTGYQTRAFQLEMDRRRNDVEMLAALDITAPTFAGLASATDRETGGEVALAWAAASDSESGLRGYNVYYHTVNDAAAIIAQGIRQQAPAGALGAIVGGLDDWQAYYFIVRAKDNEGNEEGNAVIKSATPTRASFVMEELAGILVEAEPLSGTLAEAESLSGILEESATLTGILTEKEMLTAELTAEEALGGILEE